MGKGGCHIGPVGDSNVGLKQESEIDQKDRRKTKEALKEKGV